MQNSSFYVQVTGPGYCVGSIKGAAFCAASLWLYSRVYGLGRSTRIANIAYTAPVHDLGKRVGKYFYHVTTTPSRYINYAPVYFYIRKVSK